MGFTSTLRSVLDLNMAPFDAGLTASDRRMLAFANNTKKSARESAAVFQEIAAAEASLSAARMAQAEAVNRSITAQQNTIGKSASASASVFEEAFANSKLPKIDLLPHLQVKDQVRRTEKEVGGLADKLKNKFSAANIGMSLLGGAGIGSAWAIISTGVQLVADKWAEAEASSKRILEYAERQSKALGEKFAIGRTDSGTVAVEAAEIARLKKERDELTKPLQSRDRRGALTGRTVERELSRTERERVAEIDALIGEADTRRSQAQDKIEQKKKAAAKQRVEDTKRAEAQASAELGRNIEQLDKLQRDADLAKLSADERINKLIWERSIYEKGAAVTDKIKVLELTKQIGEEEEKRKERLEAMNKASMESIDKLFDSLDKVTKAADKVNEARDNLQKAQRDQSGATLKDVQSGQRGSSADQARAREVARLEAQARRFRDDPNLVLDKELTTETGEKIRLKGDAAADYLTQEANRTRLGISSLTSAEQNPLAAAQKTLDDSLTELKTISAGFIQSGAA